MRALLQRVEEARVEVDGQVVGSCGKGLLVLLGVGEGDTEREAAWLWHKVSRLRIFADDDGHANLSLVDVGGDVLVVSQFTLYANTRKGLRPSFAKAAPPDVAEALYERFLELARAELGEGRVGAGVFGAHMRVSLVNDGPFTVMVESV